MKTHISLRAGLALFAAVFMFALSWQARADTYLMIGGKEFRVMGAPSEVMATLEEL